MKFERFRLRPFWFVCVNEAVVVSGRLWNSALRNARHKACMASFVDQRAPV
jgi:hypothetical protein